MKKRTTLKIALVIAFIVVALKTNLLWALFALIFLGMIPGTNLSIPPAVMMIAYPVGIIAVVYWLAHQPLYIGSKEKQEKTARAVARKRVAQKTRKVATKRKTARA